MSRQEDFEHEIFELQKSLNAQNIRLRICMNENDNIRRRIASLKGRTFQEEVTFESIALKQIAIAKGRLLSPQQFQQLNENDYDVVLNCVDRKLLARKDPDRHTNLEECDCSGIGPDRLKLLRCWLENPNLPVCEETIPRIFGDVASMTPNALARTMLDLRRCLWGAPYIITVSDWGESVSHTGSVYVLNDKYRYLIVRYKI